MTKLKAYDEVFKNLHFQIVDLIDEEDETVLENEQAVLDKFNDGVFNLTVCVEALISHPAPGTTPGFVATVDRKPLTCRLTRLWTGLNRVDTRISD